MKRKAALCLSVLVFAVLVVTACSNAGQKQEEIPNPMVRYDTIDQIEKKLGIHRRFCRPTLALS